MVTANVTDPVGRRLKSGLARLTEGTRRAYDLALRRFSEFCGPQIACVGRPWWEVVAQLAPQGRLVTCDLVDRYVNEACTGLAAATIAQRLAALRWAMNLMRSAGIIEFTVDVRSPKIVPYRDTAGPNLAAVQAVIASADATPGLIGCRDAALVRTLFIQGLRRGEVSSLSMANWDRERRVLFVLGKGRLDRQPIAVATGLADRIDRYLAARGALTPTSPLFATHGPRSAERPLGGEQIRRILIRLSKHAGLGEPIRPHQLRHASVTSALDVFNGDLRRVARFSRHVKLETVAIYDDRRRDLAGEVAQGLEDYLQPGSSK